MVKKLIFFPVLALMALIYMSYGCNMKTVVTTWGPTETSTPVYSPTVTSTVSATATMTRTPGQVPQANFYNFDSTVDGWVLNSPYITLSGYGTSVAHNTTAAFCDGGTGGSLQLNTDFSGSSDFHAVARISLGGDQNLEYHTVTARVFAPAGICTATDPITVQLFVGVSTITSTVWDYSYNLTAEGWYDLSWTITTYGMGITHYQHVNEIGIVLRKGLSTTVTYAGPVYIDTVAW